MLSKKFKTISVVIGLLLVLGAIGANNDKGSNQPQTAQQESSNVSASESDTPTYSCTLSNEISCNTANLQDCITKIRNSPSESTSQEIILGILSNNPAIISVGMMGVGMNAYTSPNAKIEPDKAFVIVPGKIPNEHQVLVLARKQKKLFVLTERGNIYIAGSIGQCTDGESK